MDPRKQLELIHRLKEKRSARSLTEYLNEVVISCGREAKTFGSVMEDWQKLRNDRMVPAIEYVSGIRNEYRGPMYFFECYGKGHDKTSFQGRLFNWLLGFAPRKGLRFCCSAKDAEQASIIRDCMYREAELNKPWLWDRLDFSKKTVTGKENGSQLHILTSDAAGSHGTSYDVTVCEEISHWQSKDMFDALFYGTNKKNGNAAFIVLTNAGHTGTWQHGVFKLAEAEAGKTWSFFSQPHGRPMASWITPQAMEDARKISNDLEFRRLFCNEWVNLNEERGVFKTEDVDAAVGKPQLPPKGAKVVLGIDYGLVNDRTCLCAVWWTGEKLHLIEMVTWQGTPQKPIKAIDIERWIDSKLRQYPKAICVFDKFQLEPVIQAYEERGVEVQRFEYRGGKQLYTLAENLRTLLQNGRLVIPENAGYLNGETLVDELKEVIFRPMSYGYRIDHEATKNDDRVVALGMAALEAVKHVPIVPMTLGKTSTSQQPLRQQVGSIFSQDHLANRGLYGAG